MKTPGPIKSTARAGAGVNEEDGGSFPFVALLAGLVILISYAKASTRCAIRDLMR